MRKTADRRWWIPCLLAVALATGACARVELFAKASHLPQDGWFFAASELAAYEPMWTTRLPFELQKPSLVTITFSALGYAEAAQEPSLFTTPVALQCRLDGRPCNPGGNESQTQFLFPPWRPSVLCCDSRAYTWVVPQVPAGRHTVMIWGHVRNPDLVRIASILDWSLVVHAVGQ
jgi:hypothetical protein